MAEMVAMLNSLTGFGYSPDELARTGDRIWYIKRALGSLMGATREDDRLPRRILEPHIEGTTSSLHSAVYPQFMSLVPLQKLRIEKLRDITAMVLSRFLYPNMDKILTMLNKLPFFSARLKKLARGDEVERKRKTVDFDQMIQEFYALRDIDAQGRPSRRRLEEVGLADVAGILHS
jgi:aldehyde:ferredoxin oxidoreductase